MRATTRRVHRSDATTASLVALARQMGALVYHIGRPVDLLVYFRGHWMAVECKSKGGRYTPDQHAFLAECTAKNATVYTWRTASDVLAALGVK